MKTRFLIGICTSEFAYHRNVQYIKISDVNISDSWYSDTIYLISAKFQTLCWNITKVNLRLQNTS